MTFRLRGKSPENYISEINERRSPSSRASNFGRAILLCSRGSLRALLNRRFNFHSRRNYLPALTPSLQLNDLAPIICTLPASVLVSFCLACFARSENNSPARQRQVSKRPETKRDPFFSSSHEDDVRVDDEEISDTRTRRRFSRSILIPDGRNLLCGLTIKRT